MIRYVGRFAVPVAMAAAGYFLIYRPLQLRWGATPQELTQVMRGDEIQPHPILNATRCVTIRASPEQIWPWLVQTGYRRAGWYGYDWIDNHGIPDADRILAKWQELKVGDVVSIWKNLDFPVGELEANRYLVFASKRRQRQHGAGIVSNRSGSDAFDLENKAWPVQLALSVDLCADVHGSR